MSTILNVHNLNKKYGDKTVLDNISFKIEKGDIVGLIGDNGAGKSTLISILAGVNAPDSGTVKLCDNLTVSDCKEYYKNLCVAFDQSPFYPHLSGIQNLKIYSTDKNKIEKYLKLCDIYEAKDKKVSTYSLGMKQKLNIARACLMWSNLMIMDEPINGLDIGMVIDIKKHIQKKSKEGASVLISSHALKELLFFCNKFKFIHKGRIIVEINAKSNHLESYDSYGDLESTTLLKWLSENTIDYLKVPILNKIYFKKEITVPESIIWWKIEDGTNILENIYFQIKKLDM